jgi:hypothetical protein
MVLKQNLIIIEWVFLSLTLSNLQFKTDKVFSRYAFFRHCEQASACAAISYTAARNNFN